MGKFVKIILYILLLMFVFIWFSTVFKSCGKDHTPIVVDETIEAVGETMDDLTGGDASDFEEDLTTGDNTDDSENEIDYSDTGNDFVDSGNGNSERNVDYSTESSDDLTSNDNTSNVSNSSTSSNSNSNSNSSYTAPSYSGNSSGQYMVVAGSYLVRSNAENMVRKLENMGYNNSEIAVFQNSQYNSVIAGRYDNYNSAVDVVNQLKKRDIKAYAHRKK